MTGFRERWSRFKIILEDRLPLVGVSLRARVALGVALPVLLAMITLSGLHYLRAYQMVESQARLSAIRLGEMLISSLSHAMLFKDGSHLVTTLEDIGESAQIDQIQVVGISGKVLARSGGDSSPQVVDQGLPDCQVCHRYAPVERPRVVELESSPMIERIAAPINNEPECHECHDQPNRHLGVLLIDLSLASEKASLMRQLQIDLVVSALITLLISLGIYGLIHRLVVRRIDAISKPLAAYAGGDLSARFVCCSRWLDELCQLGFTFNRMADEIERYTQEQEAIRHLRQRAIVEERERIARELHDGMAQVLGYVNTKAMAVRLMLQKGRIQAATENLLQLEEAARGLFVDVREAILGLKLAGEVGTSFNLALRTYVDNFCQMCQIPVTLELQPEALAMNLPAETELQLLRVVQEALTNIRKHADAAHVWIELSLQAGNLLHLSIRDDGRGFSTAILAREQRVHYGLESMRERCEAIGANFHLETEPGRGTRVLVQLQFNGKP